MKQAIFLVGGPGSGKNILLSQLLEPYNLIEYNIHQIKEHRFYQKNMVIMANAYEFDLIKNIKQILENNYYSPSLIFVDVSLETAKNRLKGRQIDETILKNKIELSFENFEKFSEIFNQCFYFDNNYNLSEQVEQINLLQEEIKCLFESSIEKFRKKVKAKKTEVAYDPTPTTKDGLNSTYDTRAAGNGDLIRNYQTESLDPNPLEQGIGFGSIQGNTSNQEPMQTLTTASATNSPLKSSKLFKRIKKIIGKNTNA